ncbi:MAG TPA: hypothetical protein PKB10_03835, partial [Tepidisphaeraceae bacterium]|nr:hypothetical protein [Tepidisphaeraceae bacterium]
HPNPPGGAELERAVVAKKLVDPVSAPPHALTGKKCQTNPGHAGHIVQNLADASMAAAGNPDILETTDELKRPLISLITQRRKKDGLFRV